MNKLEARELLNEAEDNVHKAVAKAVAIANEHGLAFSLNIADDAYGAGSTYYPPKFIQREGNEWLVDRYYLNSEEGGWVASSEAC